MLRFDNRKIEGDDILFAAHISDDKSRVQTVAEHCRETAEIARKHGQACGPENTSELAGIFHDLGKFTDEFSSYIQKYFSRR